MVLNAGEEDVEAALELGGAVIGGQDGGEAAEQRELADWQLVQGEPEEVVGLVGLSASSWSSGR